MDSITDGIMQEISSDDIQKVMDSTLKGQSFDFSEYIGNIINGQSPFPLKKQVSIYWKVYVIILSRKKIYTYIWL